MTQHIEDRLEALGEKATKGPVRICSREICVLVLRGDGSRIDFGNVADVSHVYDAEQHVVLHNASPALLAVVRAAREMRNPWGDSHVIAARAIALDEALASLDKVEV